LICNNRWSIINKDRMKEKRIMEEINLHTLLFADKVITEDNGKKGIIGVFNIFNFPRFHHLGLYLCKWIISELVNMILHLI